MLALLELLLQVVDGGPILLDLLDVDVELHGVDLVTVCHHVHCGRRLDVIARLASVA